MSNVDWRKADNALKENMGKLFKLFKSSKKCEKCFMLHTSIEHEVSKRYRWLLEILTGYYVPYSSVKSDLGELITNFEMNKRSKEYKALKKELDSSIYKRRKA